MPKGVFCMAGIVIHDFDFQKLIDFAATAQGEVYLETPEGDVLNLKSKLTQLIALSCVLNDSNVEEARVNCTNPEDESRLFRMNLYHEA